MGEPSGGLTPMYGYGSFGELFNPQANIKGAFHENNRFHVRLARYCCE